MVFAALAPTILETVGGIIARRLTKKNVPIIPEVIEQAAHEATQAIHNDPGVALVPVKSGWVDPTIWTAAGAIVASIGDLTLQLTGSPIPDWANAAILLAAGAFIWWHRRRSTSINAAAAVNVLKKPAKGT